MERIGSGEHVLLVCDYNIHPKFTDWLYKNGYKNVSHYGYYEECPMVYVNIEYKTFFPYIPGIKITDCLNRHAITVVEFKTILKEYETHKDVFPDTDKVTEIYEKYKGKDLCVFNTEQCDYDLTKYPKWKKKIDKLREEEDRLYEEEQKIKLEKEKNTLCFFDIPSTIQAIEEVENLFTIKRKSIKCKGLPKSGNYKGEITEMTIMGDSETECEVCFIKDSILLYVFHPQEDMDSFMTLRIFKDIMPEEERRIIPE